tara:strand:- start:610 stop:1023 length:414 start_codon:yes stop_codon:yes gene_type:complete
MSTETITQQDTFIVTINLVTFVQSNSDAKVCLAKTSDEKYIVPNRAMSKGENCYDVAHELIDSSCSLDRTKPFAARLVSSISGENFVALVFRLDIPDGTSVNEDFVLMNGEQASEAYVNNKYYEHYGDVVRVAVQNG